MHHSFLLQEAHAYSELSTAGDIYAFGLIMYEVLTYRILPGDRNMEMVRLPAREAAAKQGLSSQTQLWV